MTSINDLASLIEEQGKLAEAIPLFTEELEGYVALHGIDHEETRDAAEHLAGLLGEAGEQKKAKALAKKHGL